MNNKKRKGILIGIVALFCICLILTNSYAFWSITATQSGTNVVSSGCFDLDFTEGDAISLDRQFPIIDADSENLSPYTFTITNTCNLYASYQVNLEVLPVQGTETKLEDQYVKVSLNNSNKKILTEHEEVSTTISGAITSYKLTTGELAEDESITYDLREWLEENTPISQVNTSFRSKIVVIAVPAIEPCANCGMLRVSEITPEETAKFLNSPSPVVRSNIESIVFVNHKTVPGTSLGSWDVSAAQDNSVVAWYEDVDSDSKYEITIGSTGGVKGNSNSMSLFRSLHNLDSIDLTHFYTHEVTNMSDMFTGVGSVSFTLDLGENFDTSKVIDMHHMFNGVWSSSTVLNLDLGDKFDTSNVIDMSYMFVSVGHDNPNFTLDLGDKFNTSNVTNMQKMFSYTGGNSTVFTLDLGDKFDTSNVTNMSEMFSSVGHGNPNFILDLGDKFDTSNVTDMSYMFDRAGYINTVFILNLGNMFDTSNVTNMRGMFNSTGYNSTALTLDLRNKFNTSKVTDMSRMFLHTGYNDPNFTLDLGDIFDTSNVTNMSYMFYETGYSSTIFTLDLGDKFYMSKVTNMEYMFRNTGRSNSNLILDLRNFNVDAITTTNTSTLATGNTSHTLYASNSNIGFMTDTGKGFTGTIINCTTSPASCPQ